MKNEQILGFTIKELLGENISKQSISFLNKQLKRYLELSNTEPFPRRIIKGESYPSNQWHDDLKLITCALYYGYNEIINKKLNWFEEKELINELVDLQIDYTIHKQWGFGVPYYSGDWEDRAKKLGLFPENT